MDVLSALLGRSISYFVMTRPVRPEEYFGIETHNANPHQQVGETEEAHLKGVTTRDQAYKNILRQKGRTDGKCHEEKTYNEEKLA
jgi:hypothetical protein